MTGVHAQYSDVILRALVSTIPYYVCNGGHVTLRYFRLVLENIDTEQVFMALVSLHSKK